MAFSFSYPNSPYILATASVVDISRVVIGTEPSNTIYSLLNPPSWLTIDASNGTLTGRPSFLSISPLTLYTVRASYDSFYTTATLEMSVNFTPVFSYPSTPVLFILNRPMYIVPTTQIQNTTGVTYRLKSSSGISLSQLGLEVDSVTGIISGIPIRTCVLTTYLIEANNGGITYDASAKISIQTIPIIHYPQTTYNLTQNTQVSILPLPVESQTEVIYSMIGCSSPRLAYTLPLGLFFNTSTGEISGVPSILTTYRSYTITATNSVGSSSVILNLNVIQEVLAPPVIADNFSSETLITNPVIAMRRKAEIFKYNKNSSKLTKLQNYALLAKGNGPAAKRAWGTQGDAYTNPNISGLPQVGNTLVCNTGIRCSPTSSSDVPGPIMNLCYDPAIPLMGYNAPNRQKVNIGFKWPQRVWQVGDNGFPIGKAGSG
jgi:hypothetical protein